MQTHRTVPPRREQEIRAWTMVLDSVEDAIDVEGLYPYDRGVLAMLHQVASELAGELAVMAPAAPRPRFRSPYDVAREPGGIYELDVKWWQGTNRVLESTLVGAGYARIANLERVRREHPRGLLSVRGIGPCFARVLDEALDRHQAD